MIVLPHFCVKFLSCYAPIFVGLCYCSTPTCIFNCGLSHIREELYINLRSIVC